MHNRKRNVRVRSPEGWGPHLMCKCEQMLDLHERDILQSIHVCDNRKSVIGSGRQDVFCTPSTNRQGFESEKRFLVMMLLLTHCYYRYQYPCR